jgi:tellurite resistance protein TerC
MIGIMGGTVLLIGVVMIVLPGPAILVIPAGLGILATE